MGGGGWVPGAWYSFAESFIAWSVLALSLYIIHTFTKLWLTTAYADYAKVSTFTVKAVRSVDYSIQICQLYTRGVGGCPHLEFLRQRFVDCELRKIDDVNSDRRIKKLNFLLCPAESENV
jgi:hypothetical protein